MKSPESKTSSPISSKDVKLDAASADIEKTKDNVEKLQKKFDGIQDKLNELKVHYLRNRSALAVNCCAIIHCLEVSCKEDQITSAQGE